MPSIPAHPVADPIMNGKIRLATEEDAAGCLEIYRPIVLESAISFEMEVPTRAIFAGRIAETLQRTPWLVCQSGCGIAGYAYAGRFRPRPAYQWSVEVTVYVAENRRGRGVGRALYRNLLDCLRRQGFRNAYAFITLPNPGSAALHEALGFEKVGVWEGVGHKLGGWHDVGWWQLRLRERPLHPEPPLPLSEVAPVVRWESLS